VRKLSLPAFLLGALLFVGMGAGPASASLLITIDKLSQQMTVTVDGVPKYHWPVSTGRFGYGTPSGTYHPFRMEADYFSKEWDDAPMPHSIFFTGQGHAIHGTPHTANLGRPVSHGCVRLSPDNAATLYSLVSAEGMGNTTVVVEGMNFGFTKVDLPSLHLDKPLFPKLGKTKSRVTNWLDQTFGRPN
jgi:hypothetical protein